MVNRDTILAQIVLHNSKPQFFRDFDLIDVKDEIVGNIITEQEYRQIVQLKHSNYQIDKLFYILGYDKNKFYDFIEAITEKYDWLSELLTNLQNNREYNMDAAQINNKLCVLRSEMPRLADFNIHRHKYVSKLLKKKL